MRTARPTAYAVVTITAPAPVTQARSDVREVQPEHRGRKSKKAETGGGRAAAGRVEGHGGDRSPGEGGASRFSTSQAARRSIGTGRRRNLRGLELTPLGGGGAAATATRPLVGTSHSGHLGSGWGIGPGEDTGVKEAAVVQRRVLAAGLADHLGGPRWVRGHCGRALTGFGQHVAAGVEHDRGTAVAAVRAVPHPRGG